MAHYNEASRYRGSRSRKGQLEAFKGRHCWIAEIFLWTPTIREAILGRVATVRHSQNKAASTEDGVAQISVRQRWDSFWRCKTIPKSQIRLPLEHHFLSICNNENKGLLIASKHFWHLIWLEGIISPPHTYINLHTASIKTTFHTQAFCGRHIGVASEAIRGRYEARAGQHQ